MYTPSLSTLRNIQYSCTSARHDMRLTRIIPAFARHRTLIHKWQGSRVLPASHVGMSEVRLITTERLSG